MNKQEFQQTIKNMKPPKFFTAITLSEAYEAGFEEAKGNALCNSCFLNEPEKPVVPQFIADYIASEQRSYSTLSEAIDNMDDEKEVLCWFYDNSETFAKAWLFGYEVEKEKLYTVKFSNEDFGKIYIGFFKKFNKLGISSLPLNDDEIKSWFTEDELKRFKFWDNPAFEIKEVEE